MFLDQVGPVWWLTAIPEWEYPLKANAMSTDPYRSRRLEVPGFGTQQLMICNKRLRMERFAGGTGSLGAGIGPVN